MKHKTNWRDEFGYTFQPMLVDVRFGMMLTHGFIRFPVRALRLRLFNEVVPVEATPHFRWIKALVEQKTDAQAEGAYRNYVETRHLTDPDVEAAQVRELVGSVLATGPADLFAVIRAPKRDENGGYIAQLLDGTHRTAIARALSLETMTCRVRLRNTMFNRARLWVESSVRLMAGAWART